MYTFANRVMLIRRYVLHQDESLTAKILKKTCFYFMFLCFMFSFGQCFRFLLKMKISQASHSHIGKNEGATALFFTVSLGPKNLFFCFFFHMPTP